MDFYHFPEAAGEKPGGRIQKNSVPQPFCLWAAWQNSVSQYKEGFLNSLCGITLPITMDASLEMQSLSSVGDGRYAQWGEKASLLCGFNSLSVPGSHGFLFQA